MSKKSKMLKRYAKRRSLPKHIAGVKIPKTLRRAADTELGAAVMAEVLIGAAGVALMSPAARKLRTQIQTFAVMAAHSLGQAAQGAASSISDTFTHQEPEPPPSKRKASPSVAAAH
ncbi:MAG: hypothetical protein SGJ21_13080 [Alphaproteobacteria bacterium]|nr:hypothetical protein [Alphaproteobacteria bacterium]